MKTAGSDDSSDRCRYAAESEAIRFLTRFGRAPRFRESLEMARTIVWGEHRVDPIAGDEWFAQFFVEWFMFDFIVDNRSKPVAEHALRAKPAGVSAAARQFMVEGLATPLQVTRVEPAKDGEVILHDLLQPGRDFVLTDREAIEQLSAGELLIARVNTMHGETLLLGTPAILQADEEEDLLREIARLREELLGSSFAGMARTERMVVSSAIVAYVGKPIVARGRLAAANPGIGRLQ